jgi:hypothetical protein
MLELPLVMTKPPEEMEIFDVVVKGNTKLGKSIHSFSLPAIFTCPGSTIPCRDLCYACRRQSHFMHESVQDRYWSNMAMSLRPDFPMLIAEPLSRIKTPTLRWHVSGDFYDDDYAHKVFQAARMSPRATMTSYTRSWRDPAVARVLVKLAALPNFHLWYSCDYETGKPKAAPARVRLAYMQTTEEDIPPFPVDLFFRVNNLRNTVRKHIAGTMVCPVENGITQTTCAQCKVCFKSRREP